MLVIDLSLTASQGSDTHPLMSLVERAVLATELSLGFVH